MKHLRRYVAFMKAHPVWGCALTAAFCQLFVYGSTKKTAVDNLRVQSDTAGVTAEWDEPDASARVVRAVLQRRLKGTAAEGWTDVGEAPAGAKGVRVEGFTLDRDYEYRVWYVYETEETEAQP